VPQRSASISRGSVDAVWLRPENSVTLVGALRWSGPMQQPLKRTTALTVVAALAVVVVLTNVAVMPLFAEDRPPVAPADRHRYATDSGGARSTLSSPEADQPACVVERVMDVSTSNAGECSWSLRCNGRAGRALVLVSMDPAESEADPARELDSLVHLARHGLYSPSEPTQLFHHVDFAFHRADPVGGALRSSTTAALQKNLRLVWTPAVPCDLCAHAAVIDDVFGGAERVRATYRYIVLMDVHARVPQRRVGGLSWIDLVALGGEESLLRGVESRPLVASSLTAAGETSPSVVGVPAWAAVDVLSETRRLCSELDMASLWRLRSAPRMRCPKRAAAAMLHGFEQRGLRVQPLNHERRASGSSSSAPSRRAPCHAFLEGPPVREIRGNSALDLVAPRLGRLLRHARGARHVAAGSDSALDDADPRSTVHAAQNETATKRAYCTKPYRCRDPRCFARWNRTEPGCEPSPYFHGAWQRVEGIDASLSNRTFMNPRLELGCSGRTSQRELLLKTRHGLGDPPVSSSNYSTTDDHLYAFKRHTAWLLTKWYDWNGNCKTTTVDGALRGSHWRADALYHLENFCVSPSGEISGRDPNVTAYEGIDESRREFHEFDDMLSSVKPLTDDPPCFFDTDIVVFSVGRIDHSPSDMLYRAGSLLRVIEEAYGVEARDQHANVTVMYLVQHSSNVTVPNAAELLMDIAGTSHFAVRHPSQGLDRETLGFDPDPAALQRRVCFRHAVLWQDSWRWQREHRTSFRRHGRRTVRDVETVHLLNSHLRACLQFPPRRRRARAHAPHVLLAVHSARRGLQLQPYLVDVLGRLIRDTMNGTLEVTENDASQTFAKILAAYSRADVLIARADFDFTWQLFMPPGAVSIEFNSIHRSCAGSGINPCRDSESNGGALAAQGTLVVVADHGELVLRRVWGYATDRDAIDADLLLTPALLELAIRKAACVRGVAGRLGAIDRQLEEPQRDGFAGMALAEPDLAACGFMDPTVNSISVDSLRDASGDIMSRLVLQSLYPEHDEPLLHSRRLAALARRPDVAANLSRAWLPFRMRPPGQVWEARVMIVEPCYLRLSTLVEFLFFRDALTFVPKLTVAELASGRAACATAGGAITPSTIALTSIADALRRRLVSALGDAQRCRHPCDGSFDIVVMESPLESPSYDLLLSLMTSGGSLTGERSDEVARRRTPTVIEFDGQRQSVQLRASVPISLELEVARIISIVRAYRDACGSAEATSHTKVRVPVAVLVTTAAAIGIARQQLSEFRDMDFCSGNTVIVVVTEHRGPVGWLDRFFADTTETGSSALRIMFFSDADRVAAVARALRFAFAARWHEPWKSSAVTATGNGVHDPQAHDEFALVLDTRVRFPALEPDELSLLTIMQRFSTASNTRPLRFRIDEPSVSCFVIAGPSPGRAPLLLPYRALRVLGPTDADFRAGGPHEQLWAVSQAWYQRGVAMGLSAYAQRFPGAGLFIDEPYPP